MGKPVGPVVERGAEALERDRQAFDAAVAATPGVDPFCSRSDWLLPFHHSHGPELDLIYAREGEARLALVRTRDPRIGWVLQSVEHAWRFACPAVGPGAGSLLQAAVQHAQAQRNQQHRPQRQRDRPPLPDQHHRKQNADEPHHRADG